MANLQIIRRLCEEKKMTLVELAERLELTSGALQKIMSRGSTHVVTLEKMAEIFGVSPAIFFETDEPVPLTEKQKAEIELLNRLLAEKERTIEILRKQLEG